MIVIYFYSDSKMKSVHCALTFNILVLLALLPLVNIKPVEGVPVAGREWVMDSSDPVDLYVEESNWITKGLDAILGKKYVYLNNITYKQLI